MKQTAILLFALAITSLAIAQSNSLQEGNNCFGAADYACAIEKYKEAIKSPDERQKKIAGDNLRQAEKCFELRRMADAAFNSKNFIKAKEYYLSLVNENSKDEYAKAQLNEIKIALITLSVSKNTVLFSSSGGKEIIYVTTEADSYAVGLLPSWCSVQKFEKYFSITCLENTSITERTDNFTVSAGSKTEKINIRQSGKQIITLSVSKEQISFTSSTGNSGPISVYTNAEKFSISMVPSWCSVQTFKGYFVVTCSSNNSTQSRYDWFKVTAGNNEVKVYVTQEGYKSLIESKPINPAVTNKIKKTKCFNCPKTKDTWGLTAGYSQLDYDSYYNLEGVHLGLRIEPLFKYGFGLNTGLVLSAYLNDGASLNGSSQFGYYGLNVPLHLEYRLNFSKKFNLFAYGGVGFNVHTNSTFDDNVFPATLEYGGGFRVGHVQFNVGKSSYMGDFKNIGDIGKNVRPFQNLILSISYMF